MTIVLVGFNQRLMISGRSAQGGPHQRHGFKPLWPSSATAAPTRPMINANPWELHQMGENLQVVCRGRLRNGCAKPVFDRALSRVKRPQNPYKIEHPYYVPVVMGRGGGSPGGAGGQPARRRSATGACTAECLSPGHNPTRASKYTKQAGKQAQQRAAHAAVQAHKPHSSQPRPPTLLAPVN